MGENPDYTQDEVRVYAENYGGNQIKDKGGCALIMCSSLRLQPGVGDDEDYI